MTKVLATIEIEIEAEELIKFTELSKELSLSVPETVIMCMLEKRDEYLDTFNNNVPSNNDDENTSEKTTTPMALERSTRTT